MPDETTHLALSSRIAICGHRRGFMTVEHEHVTCASCLAMMRADAAAHLSPDQDQPDRSQ